MLLCLAAGQRSFCFSVARLPGVATGRGLDSLSEPESGGCGCYRQEVAMVSIRIKYSAITSYFRKMLFLWK